MKNLTTEQKILQAAEHEFLAKGYAGARTVTIAQKVGVSHAMLHYYFRTKEQLFATVVAEKMQYLGELMLLDIDKGNEPLPEKLRKTIADQFDLLVANPSLPTFVVAELSTNPERYASILKNVKEKLAEATTALQLEINKYAPVDASSLLVEIMSLNLFPFMARPIAELLPGDQSLDSYKQRNISLILSQLGLQA